MEQVESEVDAKTIPEPITSETPSPATETVTLEKEKTTPPAKKSKRHDDLKLKKKSGATKSKKKAKKVESSDDDDSEDSDDSSSSSDDSEADDASDSSSSGSDSDKSKRKARKAKLKAQQGKRDKKSKKQKKRSKGDDSSDEERGDSDTSATEGVAKARLRKMKLQQRRNREEDEDDYAERSDSARRRDIQLLADYNRRAAGGRRRPTLINRDHEWGLPIRTRDDLRGLEKKKSRPKKLQRGSKVAFKRVDQLWDNTLHNFRLRETIDDQEVNEFDEYVFLVRRRFDWEHKFLECMVDIKSKPLKEALQHVMADVKNVSLVQDVPNVEPNMLFLYLEECREHRKKLKEESKTASKKKLRKAAAIKADHLKVLIKYLDKDYAQTKKSLYPMLEDGMITFELLWALFKPNTIAYTSTYGDSEHPRAFKIDFATKQTSFMRGTWYSVDGKYLEYDGKAFGMGSVTADVYQFQGARKISSLDCFPIKYHKEAEAMKKQLIERGKKFVALKGVAYRSHNGMAFVKRKKQILKINVNGRIMVDPAIHRRINPNYVVSSITPEDDPYAVESDSNSDGDGCGCGDSDSSENGMRDRYTPSSSDDGPEEQRKKFRIVEDENGELQVQEFDPNEPTNATLQQNALNERKGDASEKFSEEELMIASPIVLGFAFSEKLWLEFTVSSISEVVWNEGAFESLVLPESQKSIVKALVSSHAFHASKSIDDIISGKGKGLVCVLHGPPGTGKTLTAEGIADYLKRPLYIVSAGDLGTDPRTLEREFQNILDVAHAWGALLLLDEADVFLEKRSIQDVHRNALVSIFLKLLEYFQGIIFLTTNRVETFDEAFVSRIHLSLRYGDLTQQAKKAVWKMFIERVRKSEGMQVEAISDRDIDLLARKNLNGRQIKNLTKTAQALAVHEDKPLTLDHIKKVIDVAEAFEVDLKGGKGYEDAMRGYM